MKHFIAFVYFCFFIMLAGIRTSHAYIDPSSMTYLIQIIAGAAIAVGAGIGFYWKRISRWLQKRKHPKETEVSAGAQTNDSDDEVYDPTVVIEDRAGEQREE